MDRFIFTESGKLIDVKKCLSASSNDHIVCYRKTRFTASVQEHIVASANSVPDVAILIYKGIIPGMIETVRVPVSGNLYPDELKSRLGPGKAIKSIWLKVDDDHMVRWWDKSVGFIK